MDMPLTVEPFSPERLKMLVFGLFSLFQPPRVSATSGPVPVMTSTSRFPSCASMHEVWLPSRSREEAYAEESESQFKDCRGACSAVLLGIDGDAGSVMCPYPAQPYPIRLWNARRKDSWQGTFHGL